MRARWEQQGRFTHQLFAPWTTGRGVHGGPGASPRAFGAALHSTVGTNPMRRSSGDGSQPRCAMAASAQAAGGGDSTGGTGAGSAGTSTGGTGQSTGTTTGGLAEQPGAGQRSAPNTNTQTTGQSITGLPPSNPTEAQAQRNRGAGTAPNGQPIGSSGSGLGSPEQPINSFNSGRR